MGKDKQDKESKDAEISVPTIEISGKDMLEIMKERLGERNN